MILIGHEVFNLCELVVTIPREQLPGHELFDKFCEYTARDEGMMMAFSDVFPGDDDQIDWCLLSFEDFAHVRVDELNGRVVFDNMNDLFRGLIEMYRYAHFRCDGVEVRGTLELLATCLQKMEGCLYQDAVMEELSSLCL